MVLLFLKSIYVRLRKTTLLRIVYCHFLASCTRCLLFRLGRKSNIAQKKRCVGELLGSAFVQTVYIFSPFFIFFLPFLSLFCPFLPFTTLFPPLWSSYILLLLFPTFQPLIFCLIPLLLFIYIPYPFLFLAFYFLSLFIISFISL